jgi:anti-sigma factor RsiW
MLISEADLEILETYLDGELPVSEAEGLWGRLSAEKELAAALDELRGQRALRQAVWQEMEPSEARAAALETRVASSIRGRRVWEIGRQWMSGLVAAAACVMIGFSFGQRQQGVPAGNAVPASLVQASAPAHEVYSVAIRDQNGNVVSMPRFDSRADAVNFTNTLNAMQAQPQAPSMVALPLERRDPNQNVVPVNDVQF